MAQYQKSYEELFRSFAGRPNFSLDQTATATAIAEAGFLRTDDTTCRCPICDLELKQSQINATFLPLRYHQDESKTCHFHTTIQREDGTLKSMADQPAQQLSKDDINIMYCANLDAWYGIDRMLSSDKKATVIRGLRMIVESSPGRAQKAACGDVSEEEITGTAVESISRSEGQSGKPNRKRSMDDCSGVPDCKRIALEMSMENESSVTDESFGIVDDHKSLPKYRELAAVERRGSTFLTWPNKTRQIPEDFIACGYFYEGNGDSVTCFSCGITSSNWTRQESAFQRHARSSSSCQFLISENGRDAIEEVVEEYGRYNPPTPERSIYVHIVTARMLRPRMDSPAARSAIEMGLNIEDVRAVLINNIKRGLGDFTSVAAIVSEVYASRNEPEPELSAYNRANVPAEPEQNDPNRNPANNDEENLLAETVGNTRRIRSQLTCCVCMESAVQTIFLPCGHLVCCFGCSAALTKCPKVLCHQTINGTITARFPGN